ncbi:Thioredoxin-related transmembrane protein 2-like protein [Diplonema papillatum]|nr:Thioredoxin-related transmembrane protein 2-like protein [Diplonema papillatum]
MKMGLPSADLLQAQMLHYLRPYYVLNFSTFALFGYARWLLANDMLPRTPEEEVWYSDLVGADLSGVSRESQIWLCYVLILVTRLLRYGDFQSLVSSALLFAKAAIFASLFIADWYLPFYFVGIWVVLFLFTSEPSFETPRRKFVKMDKKKMFDVVFQSVDESKEQAQVYWFINVWASWQKSGASKKFNPMFAEMSARYSNDFCKFTKIDAGRLGGQQIVKKLKIDDSALSKHMPSMVLFKNGKEIQRLPVIGRSDVSYLHEYTLEQIEKHFNLPKIAAETKKQTEARRDALRKRSAESKKTK